VWALARTGREFQLPGSAEDRLNAYLLLATSYDAKFATTAQFTSVRVVCNNTLSFAIQEGEHADEGRVFRVPHFREFVPEEIKGKLGLIDDSWSKFTNYVATLSRFRVTKRQAVEFFMELMGYGQEDEQEALESTYTVRKLLNTYETAPGQDIASARDTAWGLVNAVSYFTDHSRRARSQGARIDSAWFGASARLKGKAFDQALSLAGAVA
jgi:phage/plasmid-like protein (TIGR03299 family)